MNFSSYDLISLREILADVLYRVADEGTTKLGEKYYFRQIRQVVEELNFQTLFLTQELDIDMPSDFSLLIPKGIFNLKEVYVFKTKIENSERENCVRSCCTPEKMTKVFPKHCGLTNNYKHRNHQETEHFLHSLYKYDNLLFYDVDKENNIIKFSKGCEFYNKIRLVANGFMSGNIYDLKIVPPFVREAVVLRVVEKVCPVMVAHKIDPQIYMGILKTTKEELYGKKGTYQGNMWEDALYRLKRSDDSEIKALKIYYSHLNY